MQPRPAASPTLVQQLPTTPGPSAAADPTTGGRAPDPGAGGPDASWPRFRQCVQTAAETLLEDCGQWDTASPAMKTIAQQVIQALRSNFWEGPPEATASLGSEAGISHVALCSASMGRAWQTQLALPINLWHLLPWRNHCHVTLVTFGADAELIQFCFRELEWACQSKFLVLATGGAARAAAATRLPRCSGPELDSWNSSAAKNAAHKVGLVTAPAGQDPHQMVLVNLDTDDLLGPEYMPALVRTVGDAKKLWPGPCPAIRAGHGPVSGRVAIFAKDFCALGGYDQELDVAPAGQAHRLAFRNS